MNVRKLVALATVAVTLAGSTSAFAGPPLQLFRPNAPAAAPAPVEPTAPARAPTPELPAAKGQLAHPPVEHAEPAPATAAHPTEPALLQAAALLHKPLVTNAPAQTHAVTVPTKSVAPTTATPTAGTTTALSPQMSSLRQRMMQSLKAGWKKTAAVTSTMLRHPQRYHIGAAILAGLEVGGAILLAVHGDIPDAVRLIMAAAGTMGVGSMLHRDLANAQPVETAIAPIVTALDPSLAGVVNEVEQATAEGVAQPAAASAGAAAAARVKVGTPAAQPAIAAPGAAAAAAAGSVPPAAANAAAAASAPGTPKLSAAPAAASPPAGAKAAGASMPEVSTVKRVYSLLANKVNRSDGSLFKASERQWAVSKASSDSFAGDAKTLAQHLAGAEAYTLEVKGEAFPVVNVRSNEGTVAYVFAPGGGLLASGRTTKESPQRITWDTSPALPTDL